MDDDYRGGGAALRTDMRPDDRSWSSGGGYFPDDYRHDDKSPPQRPKLNLKPLSTPKEDDFSAGPSQSSRAASIFAGAKPVDTAVGQGEVEEWLQKEQERLQHQLDEPQLEQQPRERHPSWQSEETQERNGPGQGIITDQHLSHIWQKCTKEREKSLENEKHSIRRKTFTLQLLSLPSLNSL
uniref:Uncharacterized protein n=1 Tax=Pipistrellus kuhlii TaxID=59472 RepID=A0A7J7SNE1_PIPKU|nr:hypothetical protein mPipKuh1_009784 [Pipistrellus kuhlii]